MLHQLNNEYSHVAKGELSAEPNAILGWVLGGGILLVLGIGLWFVAQALLNQARPTLELEPESSIENQLAHVFHSADAD